MFTSGTRSAAYHSSPRPYLSVAPGSGFAKSVGRKNFPCGICGKQFGKKNHVARHVAAVHNNIRPFVCETCGFPFQEKRGLIRHYKVHAREVMSTPHGTPSSPISPAGGYHDVMPQHFSMGAEAFRQGSTYTGFTQPMPLPRHAISVGAPNAYRHA
jgi:hypothetical protein